MDISSGPQFKGANKPLQNSSVIIVFCGEPFTMFNSSALSGKKAPKKNNSGTYGSNVTL